VLFAKSGFVDGYIAKVDSCWINPVIITCLAFHLKKIVSVIDVNLRMDLQEEDFSEICPCQCSKIR